MFLLPRIIKNTFDTNLQKMVSFSRKIYDKSKMAIFFVYAELHFFKVALCLRYRSSSSKKSQNFIFVEFFEIKTLRNKIN